MAERPNAFARTREDHRTEIAEDYVELIYRLGQMAQSEGSSGIVRTADLVRSLDVAQPTVTKALDRLQREGLVRVKPRQHVELTEAGLALAARSHQRHEMIVQFLEALGVPRAVADLDAEGIEHHVSEQTLAAMERFLASDR
jgi:DtxR family manganese transport transcriptional regulator